MTRRSDRSCNPPESQARHSLYPHLHWGKYIIKGRKASTYSEELTEDETTLNVVNNSNKAASTVVSLLKTK